MKLREAVKVLSGMRTYSAARNNVAALGARRIFSSQQGRVAKPVVYCYEDHSAPFHFKITEALPGFKKRGFEKVFLEIAKGMARGSIIQQQHAFFEDLFCRLADGAMYEFFDCVNDFILRYNELTCLDVDLDESDHRIENLRKVVAALGFDEVYEVFVKNLSGVISQSELRNISYAFSSAAKIDDLILSVNAMEVVMGQGNVCFVDEGLLISNGVSSEEAIVKQNIGILNNICDVGGSGVGLFGLAHFDFNGTGIANVSEMMYLNLLRERGGVDFGLTGISPQDAIHVLPLMSGAERYEAFPLRGVDGELYPLYKIPCANEMTRDELLDSFDKIIKEHGPRVEEVKRGMGLGGGRC